MKKTSFRKTPVGIRYAWPLLGVILLGGAIAAAVYLSGQNQNLQGKAAVVPCKPNDLGECINAPSRVESKRKQVGVDAATNKILPETVALACKNQVFLKVDYTSVDCLEGKAYCEGAASKTAKTSVGWIGLSGGGPYRVFDDAALIPLTDKNGVWYYDNVAYRSSPKVKGLAVSRLGDGRVIVSHALNLDVTTRLRGFQAIDATMTLTGGATIAGFIDGDLKLAPDQPKMEGGTIIAGHGVDKGFDGGIGVAPTFQNLQPTSGPCGSDEIVLSEGKNTWKHYTRSCWPGDDYVVSVKCPTVPEQVSCNLYPIALNKASVDGKAEGSQINDIWNGSGSGNFGWLTWAGSKSEPTLATSLTPEGDSNTYVNPQNSQDRTISVGDYILGTPGVTNSNGVRTALDKLKTQDIVVPVWDTNNCAGGANAQYRTWKYAKVRITNYDLAGGPASGPAGTCSERPGRNKISATFKGYVNCKQ